MMRKIHETPVAPLQIPAVTFSCPRRKGTPRRRQLRSFDLSDFSIIHLTTRATNPLICRQSVQGVSRDPIKIPLEPLRHNCHKYGEISTYPHLTRGPPLRAEPFDINKIPYGALRDAEFMRLMDLTDVQIIMVLKARYTRCGALQALRATDAVEMIYYYRENEHCRVAAPWPQTLKEDWLLKLQVMDVLRVDRTDPSRRV